jgi:DNA primase
LVFRIFKERGTENNREISLGYSPESWDALTKEALGKGYKIRVFRKYCFNDSKRDRPFDRFKGRVMFPIQSMSGRTLGFGDEF